MKTIVSALLALSVLAAVAAPAGAAEFNTKKFWEQQESNLG
jgi:Ni/Co efflux regulator RcnB